MGCSYFSGIEILSAMNILESYKINKYDHLLPFCKFVHLMYALYTVYIKEIFELPSMDVYGAFTTVVVFRSDTLIKQLNNVYYGSPWMGDLESDIVYVACLIRNHVKCYLDFLDIICMKVSC